MGKVLESKGLIERSDIFWVQEKLSDHSGKIQPGTYLLNTCQTTEEMLENPVRRKNTEGQPSQEEQTEQGEDSEKEQEESEQ